MADGISNTGNDVEAAFRRITGAKASERAADGDAVLDGCNIEVKKASSNTLNQVRAVKFIPLVAYHTRSEKWFVVPAPDIVKAVSPKKRGQHTENPFESATLNISTLEKFKVESEVDLADTVRNAIKRGESFPELRDAMRAVLAESKRLAASSRDEISLLLRRLGV